jgi:asparagine synthase (glutamine-hydrolysing)
VCGIAGIKLFNNLPSRTEESMMAEALKKQNHRGPDNSTVKLHGKLVLGHNRLSIIDTNERSNQPFMDESGRYSLIFNGEIYNFHELKDELLAQGHTFTTTSDTEVLFKLLIAKKEKALDDLRGCFAFAFYDLEDDYVLLARDRMGINPLLYAIQDDSFVFGSELFVFKDLGIVGTIDNEALNYYFQYTYIPAPLTIYKEVKKLEAGHFIEIKGTNINIQSYWTPANEKKFLGTFDEAKIELKKRVEFGVISQLEADVPIGTFLSGGIDSSLVSAIVATKKPDLHTFSVSFGDQEAYDESKYALLVANHIKSNHHVIRLVENDFKQNFQAILDSFDEPFADSSAIAMWFLAQETSKHLKVALSGDGADELLAGYNKHLAFAKAKKLAISKKIALKAASSVLKPVLIRKNPKKFHKIKKFIHLSDLKWPDNYWFLASNIGEESKNNLLLKPEKTKNIYESKSDSLNDFLFLDQKYVLPNDMLKKVDLMSMRHSLEVRTPFMDKDLVKFINSLPEDWKLKGETGKFILRETFKDYLPTEIFTRSKQGFEVPINAWIKNSWTELIPQIWFEEKYLEKQKLFELNSVKELRERFFRNIGTASQEMWAYLVFQNWYQKNNVNA